MEIKSALIVDDSKMARVVLKKLLESRDVSVQTVGSGEESIRFLKKSQPDIIFMDCLMPGLDGFETTKKILQDPNCSAIPIVLCTGKESLEDEKKAFELGAAAYMRKSSSPESLQKILDEFDNQEIQIMSSQLKLLKAEHNRLSASKQVLINSINDFDVSKLSELAEKVAQGIAEKVATEVANSVSHDVSLANISSFSATFSQELNEKTARLTEELEEKIIFSIKTSLNNIHGYIDDKLSYTDKNLKDEFNNSIKIAVEELKTDKSKKEEPELNALIHDIAEKQIHESLETNLTAYATVLLDHDVTHRLIASKIDEQLSAQNKKIQQLEGLLASQNNAHSKMLNIIAISFAASSLLFSLFSLLKAYL